MPVSHGASGLSNAVSGDGERNRVSLVEMLMRLADPRSPQGKRHDLVFVLACAVIGTLAGAANYRQLARQVADLPPSLLEKLGARWHNGKVVMHPADRLHGTSDGGCPGHAEVRGLVDVPVQDHDLHGPQTMPRGR